MRAAAATARRAWPRGDSFETRLMACIAERAGGRRTSSSSADVDSNRRRRRECGETPPCYLIHTRRLDLITPLAPAASASATAVRGPRPRSRLLPDRLRTAGQLSPHATDIPAMAQTESRDIEQATTSVACVRPCSPIASAYPLPRTGQPDAKTRRYDRQLRYALTYALQCHPSLTRRVLVSGPPQAKLPSRPPASS